MSSLRFVPIAAVLALSACSGQMAGSDVGPTFQAAYSSSPPQGATGATIRQYHLSPGDLLDISVFQVPDLTKEVQVDASGMIALPLIGGIKAGGLTTSELEATIAARLKAKYMQSPQVSVFLKDSAGQRVTVDGAVEKPGVFPIQGQLTLIQALAEAGGLNTVADSGAVLVFRQTSGQKMAAKFDVKAIRSGKASDPNLFAGDMVIVDTSSTLSVWNNVKQTLPAFAFFAPYVL